jgi:hypothetical protein
VEDDKVENPFGIGAPANTRLNFTEITAQFCNALTKCPDDPLTTNAFLMTNLDCTGKSLTLDGAKLNGNGFTIKLGGNTINLQNGAKLEGVDLVGSGVAVTFLGGGGAVENVGIMGTPLRCLSVVGSVANFKTVTIEQVTCRGFTESGVYLDITGTGALDELAIRHVTFTSSTSINTNGIYIFNTPANSRIVVESVLTTGTFPFSVVFNPEILMDNLTAEDCEGKNTRIGRLDSPAEGRTLHVTNSNFLRCGLFWQGNVILEDIFVKDSPFDAMGIIDANLAVMKNVKLLSSAGTGVGVSNVESLVMDDVLAASNSFGSGIVIIGVTTAVLKDIAVNDNRFDSYAFLLSGGGDNSNVAIEDFVACNTGNVGDRVVDIGVPKGVLDVKKDFVASSGPITTGFTGCSVKDQNVGAAACNSSPLTQKNFRTCAAICGQ